MVVGISIDFDFKIDDSNMTPSQFGRNALAETTKVRLRFRLRTLLLLITVASIWMAFRVERANNQKVMVEQVLELGGNVTFEHEIDDVATRTRPTTPRPPGPAWIRALLGDHYFFQVADVSLHDATDEHLAAIGKLSEIRRVQLSGTFTDEGISSLKDMRDVEVLILSDCRVTGRGLRHLRDCSKLRWLSLKGMPFDAEASAHLTRLTSLTDIDVRGLDVTAEFIANVAQLPNLENLDLSETSIADRELRGIAPLKRLRYLHIEGTHVKGQAFADLPNLKNLRSLFAEDSDMDDAAIPHLLGLTRLRNLELKGTSITANGLERLRGGLPNCTISN